MKKEKCGKTFGEKMSERKEKKRTRQHESSEIA
jgi:hypothetical protein